MSAEEADVDSDGEYSQEELEVLTVAQLKALADTLGYTITKTKKAEIIAEILEQQEAEQEPDDPEGDPEEGD